LENCSEAIEQFYREVDARAAAVVQTLGRRLKCRRGCCSCCVDNLTVFEVEAENIHRRHLPLLQSDTPHPPGGCAFLDNAGACRIYAERPYVCRTQGLPLRWLEESAANPQRPQIVEMRDICPLNDRGGPIEALPAEACWTIGPAERRIAALQRQFRAGEMRRIEIRKLFVKSCR